jgi:hypothetical protein
MPKYDINIDLVYAQKLDDFALLADQPYNLGDKGDWFGCFRGGLYGMYGRLYGVQFHHKVIHTWESKLTQMCQVDFHVSSLLFNMDSALECFTFGLNALGWIVEESQFKCVISEADLKKINPINVVGNANKPPVPGYEKYFPTLQSHWKQSIKIIDKIMEHHDVSKHRESVVSGGMLRQYPPPGYETEIEIEGKRIPYSPFLIFQEIILTPSPKLPSAQRQGAVKDNLDILENLVDAFSDFIQKTLKIAYEDAIKTIKLSESELRKGGGSGTTN